MYETLLKQYLDKNLGETYITLEEYAKAHNVTIQDLFRDIIDGRYKTAVCLISSDETCKTVESKLMPIGYAAQSENYVTPKQYAEAHKLSYTGVLRGIKKGYYKSAIQEESNRWYLDVNDEGLKAPLSDGYVPAKEFAEKNNIHYSVLLGDLQKGYYKTAFQDNGRHWFLKPTDTIDKTKAPDPELDGYVSLKEYAETNKVNYQVVAEDVRNGLYDSVIKRKGRFIYLPVDTPCKSKSVILETIGFLTIKEYAEKNSLDWKKVKQDVVEGKYTTAKKVANVWYIKKYERPKTFDIPKNYILLSQYAERQKVDYKYILKDVKDGKYPTAKKFSRKWYINYDAICVSETPQSDEDTLPDNFVTLKEYAEKVSFSYLKIKRDVEDGLYSTAVKRKSRWYIDSLEPCKSFDKRKAKKQGNLILLREYAAQHKVSYPKIQKDVKSGIYETAVNINGRWYINADEDFKSVDKRKSGTDLISAKRYAEKHSVSYQKLLRDVKRGKYNSAEQRNSRWYIDSKEKPKS